MRASKLRKFLFLTCLIFSIGIHGGLIFLFFKTPLNFRQRLSALWFKSNEKPGLLLTSSKEKLSGNINQVLEESFNRIVAVSARRPKVRELKDDEIRRSEPLVEDLEEEIAESLEDEQPIESLVDENNISFFKEPQEAIEQEGAHVEQAKQQDFPNTYASIEEEELFEMYIEKDPFVEHTFNKSEELDFAEGLKILNQSAREAKELVDDFSLQRPIESSRVIPKERKKEGNFPQFLKDHYKSQVIEEIQEEIDIVYDQIPVSKPSYVLTNPGEYLREEWTTRSITESKLPDIEYYGLSDIANSILWEEEIHVDVSYIPDPDGHKYIFSLAIQPDFDLEAEPLQQNFYFIIDRSNSVKKQRFNGFKRAVQRALSALQEGDKFNIFILDKSVSRLSEKNLFVSAKNLKAAEEFLEKEDYKPFFSGNDLYTSLDRIFSFSQSPDELHSAILISDGNTLLGSQKQKKAILDWTEKNKGNINLHAATSGQGNNLVLLDLLSYATSGKLLYSDTNASFPRKLVKLVKDLHDPIVKEVTLDAVAADSGNNVLLYPAKTVLSPLYVKKPFVVVGTIDDLENFTLYIQGRNRGRYLNIKKTISFQEAAKGGRALEKLWAYAQANLCYDQFLKEGKNTHLKEAKKILSPYKSPICLEQ